MSTIPTIKLFNCSDETCNKIRDRKYDSNKSYIKAENREGVFDYNQVYNYYCKDKKLNTNKIIDEKINLLNIKNNMFINLFNIGRFGNYIYGAIYITLALLTIQKYYIRMNFKKNF